MKWLRDNGLTLTLLALFAASIVGQAWAGWLLAAEEMSGHGADAPGLGEYLSGGQFLSAVFENWESEFLQMAAYVVLTAHLFQRGSAESRDPGEAAAPPLKGGLLKKLYGHSLGLSLFVLFVLSFALHVHHSARHAAEEAAWHGEPTPSLAEHLGSAQLWFESFQNWQSEFLSTAVLVVLSIFLREHGSPESKPVDAPNAQTGAH
jgi:hypothetical protein